MLTLTKAQLHANALAALNDGRLQLHNVTSDTCSYSACCAVGASLTPEQAREFDNHVDDDGDPSSSIGSLIGHELVKTDDDDFACYMQSAHDQLVRAIADGTVSKDTALASFRTWLEENTP